METVGITLLRRAFRSGSAEFWRARRGGANGFSRPILVKRLAPELAADPRMAEQERTEAVLGSRLVHPNILPVLDFALHDGQLVTVVEDVRVVDLLHLLERATAARRKIPVRVALGIVRQILEALDHAHRRADPTIGLAGIAHGDLSPSNILIEDTGRVLVRDFGIPLQDSPTGPLARLGRLHGKPGYMSPELVTRGVLSPRSDLFAVGILAFELATFRRLFGGRDGAETLRAVALAQIEERLARHTHDLSPPFQDFLRKALARQPEDRYATATEMRIALDAFVPRHASDIGPELAELVAELAPANDESEAVFPQSAPVRPRTRRRTLSPLILPDSLGEGEVATETPAVPTPSESLGETWTDDVAPTFIEVEALLVGIEPVGPPPLPPEAMDAPAEPPSRDEPPPLPPPVPRRRK
ncbi:MAG: serine/threonine protein kinase [Deltaproteobacteria bacterium]|nr:serine/threonine protein kinase [Deltaproteobacteria bacterium]